MHCTKQPNKIQKRSKIAQRTVKSVKNSTFIKGLKNLGRRLKIDGFGRMR
jgi:hypothetical protein